ncbi:YczE/YyaS/YitT family protein [Bacillaceae bacterium W0354]
MNKDLIYSIVFYIFGIVIISFGVTMLILSQLGTGPWDALFVGLYEMFGLTVGSWIFIVGFILMILNSRLLERKVEIPSLITMFITGACIDFWLFIVFPKVLVTELFSQVILLVLGITCMGIGIGSYLQLEFARNPIDNLMMAVNYRTGLSLAISKMSLELLILVVAFFIGGPIGVGTIIVAFGIGPLVQFFFTRFKNLKVRLVKASS